MISGLAGLGSRICIVGPSSSGKSTLAAAIAQTRGLVAIHLDQLNHRPDTDWEPRPWAEFAELHAAAIGRDNWVIDGNYSALLPQRLIRATGYIVLDVPVATRLLRYLRRSGRPHARIGAPCGAPEAVKWLMLRHIMFETPRIRRRCNAVLGTVVLPHIALRSARQIDQFYRSENLMR